MDISICIPYFERAARFEKTLQSFISAGYFSDDYPHHIELSLVDDGSINEPIESTPSFNKLAHCIVVSYLPQKKERLNASVPLNRAVQQCNGKFILIQSPETYHENNIIEPMFNKFDPEKIKQTVLATVKTNDHPEIRWYIHPKHRPKKFWFCQMMNRKLWDLVGGLDEAFREGYGYEDTDFIHKLDHIGVEWRWAEQCVAVHQGRDQLPPSGDEQNRKIYERRERNRRIMRRKQQKRGGKIERKYDQV